jgi:hypothetical protein
MEKKIAGLIGAVAALGTFSAAQAAPTPAPAEILKASSFADLLEPIPDAVALLRVIDEAAPPTTDDNVQLAQLTIGIGHHHHHHHHSQYRRRGPVVVVPPRYRRYRHHHHHHHHHSSYYSR